MKLGDIVQNAPKYERPAVEVDVTEWLGKDDDDKVILTWRRPGVPQIYQASIDAQELTKRYPDIPFPLAMDICAIATAHEKPLPSEEWPTALFYTWIAQNNVDCFQYLFNTYNDTFTGLSQVRGVKPNDLKNSSSECAQSTGEDTP
jgi:hypothetical protein